MTTPLKLSELVGDLLDIANSRNPEISDLTLDSRQVIPGSLFFAQKCQKNNSRQYITEAVSKGASAIIIEAESVDPSLQKKFKIPVLSLGDFKPYLSLIAGKFYKHPSKNMRIIGVTGTNGKTSVSYYIAMAAQLLGIKAAVIGTLGYGILPSLTETGYTTPDAIQVQKILAELRDQGVQWVAIEVSSHGLALGRVQSIQFDTAIFTNLTQDHLDFHGDMKQYGEAKAMLFHMPNLRHAIINSDDDFGYMLLKSLASDINAISYSAMGHIRDETTPKLRALHTHLSLTGITASIFSPWGNGVLHSSLMGRFYLSNLLAVLATLTIAKIPLNDVLSVLSGLSSIPGRMETYGGFEGKPLVVVDFAHTPDALRQVLSALREHLEGELWCVFGCGGDRDKSKRPQMGLIAEMFADHIILTDDNPRSENPAEIISDIARQFSRPERAVIEHDRARAIAHAIFSANEKDIVLVAGKGHEKYQQIGDEKKPFSDALTVQMILTEQQI